MPLCVAVFTRMMPFILEYILSCALLYKKVILPKLYRHSDLLCCFFLFFGVTAKIALTESVLYGALIYS